MSIVKDLLVISLLFGAAIGVSAAAQSFLEYHRCRRHRERHLRFCFKFPGGSLTPTGGFTMKLMKGNQVPFTVQVVDKDGDPAETDGPVQVVSSNEDVLTVETQNGTDFLARWKGIGTANVQATADADLGDGVVPIVADGEVECVGGEAVGMKIVFGTPIDPNAPAPAGDGTPAP